MEKPVTFFSSGTTGIQKKLHFTSEDIARILRYLGVGMIIGAVIRETIDLCKANQYKAEGMIGKAYHH